MNKLDQTVYKKLLEVPKGKVTTYGDLARAVGLENGQRIIGQIMARNPFPVIVPCHRVVKSDGKIGGFFYGDKVKTKMLSDEGIKISDGKIKDWEKTVFRF
ncbi:MGMT family protein [Candidatus Nitrosotenuis cloacae]|uniref:Cysteine methyltransferase n=1 Tax=Candidatus Nitrosotenuis cloacae TaxID=1603555 RepID=A0A3G1B6D5_9ARCH|nr:MGMT family protein [Candidatus Nitrosotenuis cloacae]AJZ75685.1 cysteine methyltransferase [Candidatus Nitrosotenuis cloacae]